MLFDKKGRSLWAERLHTISICLFLLNVKKNQQKVNVNSIKIQQKRYFIRLRDGDKSLTFIEIFVGRESSTFTTYNIPNSFNGVSSYFNKISCSGSKWISMWARLNCFLIFFSIRRIIHGQFQCYSEMKRQDENLCIQLDQNVLNENHETQYIHLYKIL